MSHATQQKTASHHHHASSTAQQNPFEQPSFSTPSLSRSYRESLSQLVDFDDAGDDHKQETSASPSTTTTSHSSHSGPPEQPKSQQQRTKLNPNRAKFAAMLNQQRMTAGTGTPAASASASGVSKAALNPARRKLDHTKNTPDLTNKLNAMLMRSPEQMKQQQQEQARPHVDARARKPAGISAAALSSTSATPLTKDDLPEVARFRKMLQIGVPAGAVRNQIDTEGYDAYMQEAVFSPLALEDLLAPGEANDKGHYRQQESTALQTPPPDRHQQPEAAAPKDAPSPQQFLTAAVLANALQNNKKFQHQRHVNVEDADVMPIKTLSVPHGDSHHHHGGSGDDANHHDLANSDMDNDNDDDNDDVDNESLSTLGSIEAGPKSKEWRQTQLKNAQKIMHVYQSTQQTAKVIDTDPNVQLPRTHHPMTQEIVQSKERQKKSASVLMNNMAGESPLFHKQIQQLEHAEKHPGQSSEYADPAKQRQVKFNTPSEPKRLVDLKPAKTKKAANGSRESTEEETKEEIEMDLGEHDTPALQPTHMPTETPQTLPKPKMKQLSTSTSQPFPPQSDDDGGGGTMHLSDYNRRQYIKCGLLILFFVAVPIIIGFTVAATNGRNRPEKDAPLLAASVVPTNLRTSAPLQIPTLTPSITPITSAPITSGSPTAAPTSKATVQPTSSRRLDLMELLIPLSFDNGVGIQTPNTPQNYAFEWLVSDVSQNSDGPDSRMIQRFALATFYYSTIGPWRNASGWLSADDECSWYGLSCDGSAATSLQLSSNQLIGTIPNEISMLNRLQDLSLNENAMQGTIPGAIGKLERLQLLDLSSNSFSGSISSDIGGLSSMNILLLQANKLEGTMPDALSELLQLQLIRLDGNAISGKVPDEVCYAFSASQPRFYSDCGGPSPEILCPAYPCCTYCCDEGACACIYAGTGFDFLC